MNRRSIARLAPIVMLLVPASGCALAAGIFRAGFWTGIFIAAVLVVGVMMLFRGRR
jgi:hypothetical protein